jgi:hypothetical protein
MRIYPEKMVRLCSVTLVDLHSHWHRQLIAKNVDVFRKVSLLLFVFIALVC